MSFIIRQITKRADGGDIVRSRTLVQTEIIIGRATDCDIQLSDLAVMLRHLRLVQTAPGRLSMETIGGMPVEVAGKFVNRADLATVDVPRVNLGPFRLTLSNADDGAIAISAERVVGSNGAADANQENSIFSLQGAMPSRRRMAWIGAALVLIGFLLLPLRHFLSEERAVLPRQMVAQAAHPATPGQAFGENRLHLAGPRAAANGPFAADQVWSSGSLSNVHASLSNNCSACHMQAFVSVTDSACQACHIKDALPDHAAPARMAKGRMPANRITAAVQKAFHLPEGRCTSCHKEHEGEATVTTVAQRFCTDCHSSLKSRLPDTPTANVPDWVQHPDFRATLVSVPSLTKPVFMRTALKDAKEHSGLIYPHALHQSATNAVANMAQKQGLPTNSDGALPCRYCHSEDTGKVRFQPIKMERNCGACHDLAFARDGDTIRTLPHGKPEQVAGTIRDFWLSQSVAPRGGVFAFPRRTPGGPANPALRLAGNGDARRQADGAVSRVFFTREAGGNGLCTDCHVVTNTGSADITRRFSIAPVTLNSHYLPQGQFPHDKHKIFDGKTGQAACLSCHGGALTSKISGDVLVPGVAKCQQCHGAPAKALLSGQRKAGDSCDTCHAYHDGINPAAPLPSGHGTGRIAAAHSNGPWS
jgi:predicted CXXCH cytochrome family protein